MDAPARTAETGHDTTTVSWPVWIAMPLVFAVFVAGAVWSFREQTSLAANGAFHVPELLPLSIDGFAVSMAAVAWAASLDGRAAVFARLGVATGIAASAATNAAWAWQRSNGHLLTVIVAAAVPVLAMVAFEVLLSEVRRQVQRRRGLPRPVPVPWPRLIRLVLAPVSTVTVWRALALERTDPQHQFAITEGPTAWNPAHETATGTGSGSQSASSSGTSEPVSTRPASDAGTSPKRTPRTKTSSKYTGHGSRKRTDTELVSEILTNGWETESQNSLSSWLRVSKARAAVLQRAARDQLAQNSNQPPAPAPDLTPAPAVDSSDVPVPEPTNA